MTERVYLIEQRIHTLAENAVSNSGVYSSFEQNDIHFSHWEYSFSEGWKGDAWLATAAISADNYRTAFMKFQEKLRTVIPKISFVSQCYIESRSQPFLIRREDSDIAFFRFSQDVSAVPLMFGEDEHEALGLLLSTNQVRDEFFYYWNDVVNATGYTPKLLLMFSAFEALVKDVSGKKDWHKIEQILGPDLKKTFYEFKVIVQAAFATV